jgi:hypothetical protein
MILRLLGALAAMALAACAAGPDRATLAQPWYAPVNQSGDPLFAAFEGRIPCVEPTMKDCDKIKVALVGNDILFLLDGDLSPRVGTASWSYVLNRTG